MQLNWERKPIRTSPVSVLVTVLKTGPELRTTLEGISVALAALKQDHYEVLLIASGVSVADVETAAKGIPYIQVLEDDAPTKGIGTALKKGFAAAQHPLVFTLPPGYSANLLPLFLKEIDYADIIFGTRQAIEASASRLKQFFTVNYQIFGISVADPDCPVRLYRKEVLPRLPVQSIGSFAHAELLAKANFTTCLLGEVKFDGPIIAEPSKPGDRKRLLRKAYFGPPPQKQTVTEAAPIITSQAPEARL